MRPVATCAVSKAVIGRWSCCLYFCPAVLYSTGVLDYYMGKGCLGVPSRAALQTEKVFLRLCTLEGSGSIQIYCMRFHNMFVV